MSEPLSERSSAAMAVEGAIDRVCGRPRDRNPYSAAVERWHDSWTFGWDFADELLNGRAVSETRRWLQEPTS